VILGNFKTFWSVPPATLTKEDEPRVLLRILTEASPVERSVIDSARKFSWTVLNIAAISWAETLAILDTCDDVIDTVISPVSVSMIKSSPDYNRYLFQWM
jgi:hypothetical protein